MVNTRSYQSTDWLRLCEIHDASRLDELRFTVGTRAFLTLEQTAKSEGLFDDRLVVAEVDGVVQGFVAYSGAELTWLYVDPQFYKQGVGRALVRHAIADATSVMELEVLEGNMPALKLYLSEGFKIVKRIEGKLEGNEAFAAVGLVLRYEPSAKRSVLQGGGTANPNDS
ncbi:MAG: GNAT family N-acetyltransferase [Leptolyngbyaceae cyanobacterium]